MLRRKLDKLLKWMERLDLVLQRNFETDVTKRVEKDRQSFIKEADTDRSMCETERGMRKTFDRRSIGTFDRGGGDEPEDFSLPERVVKLNRVVNPFLRRENNSQKFRLPSRQLISTLGSQDEQSENEKSFQREQLDQDEHEIKTPTHSPSRSSFPKRDTFPSP